MLNLSIDPQELVETIASQIAEKLQAGRGSDNDTLAFDEATAARMLSMQRHQLRDLRLAGKIAFHRIVKNGIRYAKADLLDYLVRNRIEATH